MPPDRGYQASIQVKPWKEKRGNTKDKGVGRPLEAKAFFNKTFLRSTTNKNPPHQNFLYLLNVKHSSM